MRKMEKKNDEILNIQKGYLAEVGMRKKLEDDLGKVLQKLQEMEENKCRHEAWRAVEEKKHNSWEEEKNKMVDMIKKQQELIQRCMEKIELWDEKN